MTSTFISSGNSFHVYDSAVQTYEKLPADTFTVQFDAFSGYSLQRVENLSVGDEKVYGEHNKKLDRIAKAYNTMTRSLGVLMSGDKGMGKSLMVRMLAEKFRIDRNLPVVLIDNSTPGLAEFIDSLGECVVVFDEFEKKFKGDEEQSKFLGLFDGISSTQRLYLVTVNQVNRLNDYLVNRPGRFHYHIRFDYPTANEIREYLSDQVENLDSKEIDKVVILSKRVKMNYDHLRAVAFELRLGGDFHDVLGDLNIKSIDDLSYKVTVTDANGRIAIGQCELDYSSGATTEVYLWAKQDHLYMEFDANDIIISENDMMLPVGDVKKISGHAVKDGFVATTIRFELIHQAYLGF